MHCSAIFTQSVVLWNFRYAFQELAPCNHVQTPQIDLNGTFRTCNLRLLLSLSDFRKKRSQTFYLPTAVLKYYPHHLVLTLHQNLLSDICVAGSTGGVLFVLALLYAHLCRCAGSFRRAGHQHRWCSVYHIYSALWLPHPLGSEAITMMESWVQCMNDANATRYLNGIGLVIVLYDHALTFGEEVRLVWKAKSSFAKWLFLVNRYLVPVVLIGVAICMNNFSDRPWITTNVCQNFFTFSSLLGVVSVGIANVLVLLRVVCLWERKRSVACILFLGFLVSFCVTFALMVVVIVKLRPGLEYFPQVRMCVSTSIVPEVKAVWASPMLFEVLVLLSVLLNALDRPRTQTSEVKHALWRDGVGFFTSLTILRIFNLLLATVVRPSLILLGVFFVWAMTTLVLNRSLLNILKMSDEARSRIPPLELPTPIVQSTRVMSPTLRGYRLDNKDSEDDA